MKKRVLALILVLTLIVSLGSVVNANNEPDNVVLRAMVCGQCGQPTVSPEAGSTSYRVYAKVSESNCIHGGASSGYKDYREVWYSSTVYRCSSCNWQDLIYNTSSTPQYYNYCVYKHIYF